MAKVSSTSSSEDSVGRVPSGTLRRRLLRTIAFVILLLGVDRVAYVAAFPQFDKVMRLTTLEKPHDILIVGSSHVVWDLDHKAAAEYTGLRIGMVSVPGANMELRRHLILDYLAHQSDDQRPLVVVMEADQHSFNSARYPETSTAALLGYYHRGILRDFLWARLSLADKILNSALYVHSLNAQFVFIGARIYDRAGEMLANLFGPLTRLVGTSEAPPDAMQLPEWAQGAESPPVAADAPREDPAEIQKRRLNAWRKQYAEFDARVDPEPAAAFERLISDVRKDPRVTLILLDTPNFLLFPEREASFDQNVRSRFLKPTGDGRIQFWRFDRKSFETDPQIYADASHLNVNGRVMFTQEFILRVRELMRSLTKGT